MFYGGEEAGGVEAVHEAVVELDADRNQAVFDSAPGEDRNRLVKSVFGLGDRFEVHPRHAACAEKVLAAFDERGGEAPLRPFDFRRDALPES